MPSAGTWLPPTGGPVSIRIPVEDESRIGEARRAAESVAVRLDLDEETRSTLAIVVSEAVTNLARHARQGVAYIRPVEREGGNGVEIIAIDSGPGMADVSRSLVDGYSTGGTSGHGLGAMRRLAEMDIYSLPGAGTALVARVFASGAPRSHAVERVRVGVVCRPIEGEQACGDGWAVLHQPQRTLVMVVDGLGHGPSAADAADAARGGFLADASDRSPVDILTRLHEALRATRGAALLVAEIRPGEVASLVTVAGVGNITASIVTPAGSKALPSVNGTAGLTVRNPREFSADWAAPGLLVFATDGLTTRWRLDAYPRIFNHDPSIAAALLHRDHSRGRDDVTVLALARQQANTT